jgi:hypothetical protein
MDSRALSAVCLALACACGADQSVATGDTGSSDGGAQSRDASLGLDARSGHDSGFFADAASAGPDATATLDASLVIWHPAPRTSWQWQLTGTIDTSVDVAMYDIDLFEAPQAVIDELHGKGRTVICYFSAGSYEDWRPDKASFPAEVIGKAMDGWPGESWLDVSNPKLQPVIKARLDLAAQKKCDGVEPDNVDGYQNDTGFSLTAAQQLAFNRFLATEAHTRSLSVGLKNDVDQIGDLSTSFDWALNEECIKYSECDGYSAFTGSGKAVFHVEYGDASLVDTVCPQTLPLRFSTLIKKLELDAWRVACP